MKRILLAAFLGAIAMFIWSSIAHMVLPLGEAGIRHIPNEAFVLGTLQGNIAEQEGLYLFPGLGLGANPTREEKKEAMKNYEVTLAQQPSGLLLYHPAGSRPLAMGRWLLIEFAAEFVEALIVVFLLSQTRLTGFTERHCFVVLAGILAAITTNVSYWNWYGFPALYTGAYMLTQVVGFAFLGLVAAVVLKPKA